MKIAIIGGGASGICSAIYLKRNGNKNSVTVFERSDRILKKLLATGNGRCNLSNTQISLLNYFSHTPEFVSQILPAFTPVEERQFFESLGIMLCEENGRIYPYSRRANAVSDALRFECEHLGIKIRTGSYITKLGRSGSGFSVNGEFFDAVIISCGGMSAPSFGTDGNAFTLLKSLGHTITPTCYALAPVKVKENVKPLKGIRAHCNITLCEKDTVIKSESGELQLTDYGLSGIAIMQISRLCRENSVIQVDLMPEYPLNAVSAMLRKRKSVLSHLNAEDFLSGILHKTLGQYILKRCALQPSMPVSMLTEKELEILSQSLKSLSFTVLSVLGKEQSQATCGGVRLDEFNPETLESKLVPRLYCIGEALDCVGDCGGYNLHWAWTTAFVAANALVKGK